MSDDDIHGASGTATSNSADTAHAIGQFALKWGLFIFLIA